MPFWFALSSFALISLLFVDIKGDLSKFKSWPDLFSISTNILTGVIVSFVFYFFIVYMAESRRKRLIKTSALKMYRNIKRDILLAVVDASIKGGRDDLTDNLIEDTDFVETLMSPVRFKVNFEDGRKASEGFYAFENQMRQRTPEFEEIVLNFELIEREIYFILGNYKFDDQEIFDLLKRIGSLMLRLKHSQPGHDESKRLCSLIWEICAGWSMITGYRGYDIIEKAISDI